MVDAHWTKRCMIEYWTFVQYVAMLDESQWLKRALVWNAGGGRPWRSFDLWEAPRLLWPNFADEKKLESGKVQPRTNQSSMAAVHGSGCYGRRLLEFECCPTFSHSICSKKWLVPETGCQCGMQRWPLSQVNLVFPDIRCFTNKCDVWPTWSCLVSLQFYGKQHCTRAYLLKFTFRKRVVGNKNCSESCIVISIPTNFTV